MQAPRITILAHALILAAIGVGLAALNGEYIWCSGMSLMTIVGLLGSALGACFDTDKPEPRRASPTVYPPPVRFRTSPPAASILGPHPNRPTSIIIRHRGHRWSSPR
ncbi:hypothetical protein [Paludisphaera rhizosphaerae]|uniref:hypothetical protein n=1 Tax=Paludisphaera rhizosphaerae TaxID=2711216 RepID=UPI0013ECD15E|nr:hypothetical protein [Paludisphaera rhizosphaerae]